MYLNRVELIGFLGSDAENKTTPNGKAVTTLSLATKTSYLKDGERQERTEWHSIVAWDKLAQICGEYLHKGKMVYVEGSLQTRSWDDQNGQKRYRTEIKANNILMLSPRSEGAREMVPAAPAGICACI